MGLGYRDFQNTYVSENYSLSDTGANGFLLSYGISSGLSVPSDSNTVKASVKRAVTGCSLEIRSNIVTPILIFNNVLEEIQCY